jgi:hypothetical protein
MPARICEGECNKPLDSTVACFICHAPCHMSCYGLTKAVINVVNQTDNLIFLCDICLANKSIVNANAILDNGRDAMHANTPANDNKPIFDAINDLKEMVVDMQAKIKTLEKPTFASVLAGDGDSTPALQLRTGTKRRRFGDRNTATPSNRPLSTMIVGNNENEKDLAAVEPRKWMFISQLHPSTTEEFIAQYVNRQLNDTENKQKIQAFALVPREKNRDDLNFISFKLNIPESSYEALLNPEIWPKGVVVRDFVNNDRRRRAPTGHFLSTPANNLRN